MGVLDGKFILTKSRERRNDNDFKEIKWWLKVGAKTKAGKGGRGEVNAGPSVTARRDEMSGKGLRCWRF